MTVTLDDVACLLHVSIEGRMLSHENKVSQDVAVELMVTYLGVSHKCSIKNCKDEYDAYIGYKSLKVLYEERKASTLLCEEYPLISAWMYVW